MGLHLNAPGVPRNCAYAVADCGRYDKVVRDAVELFRRVAPTSHLVWQTTGSLCEWKFKHETDRLGVSMWKNETLRPEMMRSCLRDCARFNDSLRKCSSELLMRDSAKLQ